MLQESSFVAAGFWRYAFAVGLLAILSFRRWPGWSAIWQQRKPLALMGLVGMFSFGLLFFLGLQYTSALNAALLAALNPVLTLILSAIILKTSILRHQVLGIIIAFAGVTFLLFKGQFSDFSSLDISIGDFILFLSVVVFAFYNIWAKQHGSKMDNLVFTFCITATCLLAYLLILPFQEAATFQSFSTAYWLSAAGMGFLGTTLAYIFWNKGVAVLGASETSIFLNLVPFMGALFAVFFGESIYGYHVWSGMIIVLGVVVMQRGQF